MILTATSPAEVVGHLILERNRARHGLIMADRSGSADYYAVPVAWPTLHTERLVLRPLTIEDLDELAVLHAQEAFWRYPFKRGWSRHETQAFLERNVARYLDPGISVSAVELRTTSQLAGWAGLSVPTFLPEILPAVELGWRLGQQFWGHGYATEAGAAWLTYGFTELDLDPIVSIFEPDNVASGAVMNRLGFALERETTHPTLHVPVRVMSLTKATWMRSLNPYTARHAGGWSR